MRCVNLVTKIYLQIETNFYHCYPNIFVVIDNSRYLLKKFASMNVMNKFNKNKSVPY